LRIHQLLVRGAAVVAAVIGLTVLVGYWSHSDRLVRVLPGLQGMALLTAVGLLVLAGSIMAASFARPALSKGLAWSAIAVGGVALTSHLVFKADRLSPAIAQAVFGLDPSRSGHTSIATALCFLVLGAAGLNRARAALADGLGAVALILSSVAVIGYAYGVRDLYAVPVFNTMALHTACALILLSAASLIVLVDRGWAAVITSHEAGGGATRRQLTFILAPPIAGGLLLRATDAHALGPGAAMAFLVIITVTPLALLILRDGRVLNAVERERRDNAEELRRQLDAQARELTQVSGERAAAEAAMYRAQRMEAVGQLTGGIAHDFNNLLMAISGNLQLLLGRLAEDHPARRYANNATAATDKGAKLTSQLLAFSRTQKLNIRRVELDPVLVSARELIGTSLGPGIAVELRLRAEHCWAATDPDQLELAILNLALNARDAMPAGGSVIVESGECSLRLKPESDERAYLSIKVIDTGEGMPPEVAGQAVEPFFTTKERGKGTGLGLAQVYGFVRQCEGDLRISSTLGQGTTIELLLPCVEALATGDVATPVRRPSETGAGDGRLLLVVDDDDTVRGVLVETLRNAGFLVVEASDGEAGLRQIETARPGAAVIDFIMPGMNGAEVARRAQARYPGLPVVFVSGYFDTMALDGIPDAIVLRKPFDVEGLNKAVSSVLH
jgi:signal transduction histidine kinase